MPDIAQNLLLGLQTAFSWNNILYAFVGVLLGNIIGVLPGIGALAAISMLLPVTYGLDPTGALVMLAGLYYGTSFGGATTSILLNLPGTASHAVVCVDGNPLARQGKGGQAIFMAMFASFCGVCTGIILMMFFSPLLVDVASLFGPWEYFALMLMGLFSASALTSGSPLKGVASVVIGLTLGVIGTDVISGVARFSFDIPELTDGIALVALAMGFFGVTDVLANAANLKGGSLLTKVDTESVQPDKGQIANAMPSIGRGAAIGSALGVLPGAGGTIASFMSYALEQKVSDTPERFGKGAMEGVSGPEAANSSAAITAFIPTLTLGIPGDAVMALMLGAMMIHNIVPGPQMMSEHPTIFWGLLCSFLLGNIMLVILNIPLIGIWVKLLSVPYRLIYPTVLFLIAVGVYSTNNNLFDVGMVLGIGIFGYITVSLGYQPAPILLGFVLGPLMEENFMRALRIAHGDMTSFFTRPLSCAFMLLTISMIGFVIYKRFHRPDLPSETLAAASDSPVEVTATEPKKDTSMRLETLAVHAGYSPDPTTKAVAVPVYQTVAYAFDNAQHGADLFDLKVPGNIYTRMMNPTTDVLEKRVAALEGGLGAVAFASGMAAITAAIQTIAEAGDNIVSASTIYGGTYNLFAHTFPQQGIEVRFADPRDPASFAALIDDKTKVIFCESIGNPLGNVTDIRALANVALASGVPLMVDNTVPSPWLLRPMEHGADIVVHSLTKYLGGHGNSIGGIVVDSGQFPWGEHKERFKRLNEPDVSYHGVVYTEALGQAAYIGRLRVVPLRNMGASIAPHSAFLILQGIETLALRMERICSNAQRIAEALQQHPKVEWVRYAGLADHPDHALVQSQLGGRASGILSFSLKADDPRAAGQRFLDALQLFTRLVNIGDAKSLATHPASTTHRQLTAEELDKAGVTEGMVRLSIGIEHVDDLLADLEQALQAS